MALLAFTTYAQFPEDPEFVAGIPPQWPRDLLDITIQGNPPDKTWTVMTDKEYEEYLFAIQPFMDKWRAEQDAAEAAAHIDETIAKSALSAAKQITRAFHTILRPYPPDAIATTVSLLGLILDFIYLGLGKQANFLLANSGKDQILDAQYDPKNPGLTNSQYLQKLITLLFL